MHFAVVHDVDLDAGGFDDGANLLAAGSDQVADLVGGDGEHEQARRVLRHVAAVLGERLIHDVENLQARLAGLLERLAHQRDADAADLDIHLQRGDAGARAGNFEIHVAVVIFGAGDIGEHGGVVAFDHQAHGDAGAGRTQRHAGIHQRERAAADGGHGRGTVGFQNVGNQTHGVGEVGFRRKQVGQSALGERAVSDFAASRAAQEFHFAHGERREIVVQHEALEGIGLEEQIEALHVFLGAERQRGQRLRLAAGEERRTVHARAAGRLRK